MVLLDVSNIQKKGFTQKFDIKKKTKITEWETKKMPGDIKFFLCYHFLRLLNRHASNKKEVKQVHWVSLLLNKKSLAVDNQIPGLNREFPYIMTSKLFINTFEDDPDHGRFSINTNTKTVDVFVNIMKNQVSTRWQL